MTDNLEGKVSGNKQTPGELMRGILYANSFPLDYSSVPQTMGALGFAKAESQLRNWEVFLIEQNGSGQFVALYVPKGKTKMVVEGSYQGQITLTKDLEIITKGALEENWLLADARKWGANIMPLSFMGCFAAGYVEGSFNNFGLIKEFNNLTGLSEIMNKALEKMPNFLWGEAIVLALFGMTVFYGSARAVGSIKNHRYGSKLSSIASEYSFGEKALLKLNKQMDFSRIRSGGMSFAEFDRAYDRRQESPC